MKISGFFGEYRFLSNFWPADITILGIPYKSVEAAYQASKSHSIEVRETFSDVMPKEAKKLGRLIKLHGNWGDVVKITNMELCLRAKFNIPVLRARLISTEGCDLEEANTWGDQFWGTCNGKGRNILGKLLMGIRDELLIYEPQMTIERMLDKSDEIPF